MATIGLSKPYFAKYSHTGSKVTYTGGALLGKYTELSIELDSQDANILYADNAAAESDQQFTGGTATVTTDDLRADVMVPVFGAKEEPIDSDGIGTASPAWIVFDDDQNAPYVGLGGVIKKKVDGLIKWVGFVLNKTQFTTPGISAVTQGETIEWQTQQLTATILRSDAPKHPWFRISTPMDSEADAEAAVKQYLCIQDPVLGSLSVSSEAGSEAGKTKLSVTPALTPGNHYVYQTGSTVTLPTELGEDVSSGWTPWNGTDEITAATGQELGVVEADSGEMAVAAGKTTVTANPAG